MSQPQSYLPLNPREFLILFALLDGEQHGYGLVKAVSERTAGAIPMDPANLYRAVKRLKREGLVTDVGTRAAPDARNERRRYYAISKLGRQVVAAEAMRLDEIAQAARSRKLIPGGQRPA